MRDVSNGTQEDVMEDHLEQKITRIITQFCRIGLLYTKLDENLTPIRSEKSIDLKGTILTVSVVALQS